MTSHNIRSIVQVSLISCVRTCGRASYSQQCEYTCVCPVDVLYVPIRVPVPIGKGYRSLSQLSTVAFFFTADCADMVSLWPSDEN